MKRLSSIFKLSFRTNLLLCKSNCFVFSFMGVASIERAPPPPQRRGRILLRSFHFTLYMNCINRELRIVNCGTLTVTAVSSRLLSITVHRNTPWHVNNVASWLMQPTRLQLLAWRVGDSNELLMTSTPSGDCFIVSRVSRLTTEPVSFS